MKPFGAAALLVAAALPATPQIELNPPRKASTIAIDVDLVNVLCTVRDRRGAHVKGLSRADFEVREEGRPQPITHFAGEADTPLAVALLLDVSGSVSNILPVEKAAATRFFREVLRPGDRAMLAGFAEVVAVWQDLIAPGKPLEEAIDRAGPVQLPADKPVRPSAGTLLYDAVNLVARDKLKGAPGRKVMVLITDGLDLGSQFKPQDAVKAAQEADAVIYAIHYDQNVLGNDGMKALEKLAEPTGGRAFHVDEKTTLEAVFAAIQEEMRNQYSIGFRPPEAAKDGAYRRIEVKVSKPGVKVQARHGYYR